ncbi:M50 family metallopeptidase [Aestuariimicrobium ganziense]|uniref:M50 family metallopeptidase n=1 Tax=Aestuariimicrobium ganziense TaxID=2773677 RepID=UPI001940AC15|nr:M50 family metallopeptidase [Aestuariimicrobium ganziense]
MSDVVIILAAAIGFFALIMASIALHEIGHLLPGKLFDVKITQYFVGFGNTLWSRRRGETEYGFKAIPLGGYVKLIGMYPPAWGTPGRSNRVKRLADYAREAEYEEITPADNGRLFHQKKTWQKLVIMFGGPAMNLLLAFLIVLGVNMFHGQYRSTLVVDQVSECVVPADRADQKCTADDPATPAAKAGFRVGDQIVSFNGEKIDDWDELSTLIRANLDRPATIVVLRDGAQVSLSTSTVVTGLPHRLDPGRTVEAGFLGVSPRRELQRGGPLTTADDLWTMTTQSVSALSRFPVKVWNVAVDLVTGQPRDVNGPISIVGASRAAGEIAAADQIPVGDRVASWFMLLGAVNLFVALLNLVPLMPLDGGHIAGALYEAAKRRLARLRGRPDPGHVDTAMMLPVAYAVGAFLALSGLVLIVADIVSPVKLF